MIRTKKNKKLTSSGNDRKFGVTVLAGTGSVFQKMLSNSRVMGDNLRGAICLAGTGKIRAHFSFTSFFFTSHFFDFISIFIFLTGRKALEALYIEQLV